MTSILSTRRELLKSVGIAGALGMLPAVVHADGRKGRPGRKRVVRFVHMTDCHIQPAGAGSKWFATALEQVNSLEDRPSMILFGGDMVYEAWNATTDGMKSQWAEFLGTLKNSNDLPVRYCLGNHDVWGWNAPSTHSSDPMYGKQYALDVLQVSSPFYSFDMAGWHFAVLDSVAKFRNGYIAKLGHEQLDWLDRDLSFRADKPTLVMSHIPLTSACAHFFGNSERDGTRWHLPGTLMHIDARHIKDLFLRHSRVKLAISGHIHLVERVDYNGVSYLCNGAVCGNWWTGAFQETPPGYALIDLFDDGTWRREYVTYGWTA